MPGTSSQRNGCQDTPPRTNRPQRAIHLYSQTSSIPPTTTRQPHRAPSCNLFNPALKPSAYSPSLPSYLARCVRSFIVPRPRDACHGTIALIKPDSQFRKLQNAGHRFHGNFQKFRNFLYLSNDCYLFRTRSSISLFIFFFILSLIELSYIALCYIRAYVYL